MKSLIALVVLVCSFAHAAEIMVHEADSSVAKVMKGSFEVNPAMNRAWVDVVMQDRLSGRDVGRSFASVKVPGLSFDSASSRVMLEIDGQQVECGYRTGWGIFKRIVETGCTFTTKLERRLYDDGFRTYMKEYRQLYLVTR